MWPFFIFSQGDVRELICPRNKVWSLVMFTYYYTYFIKKLNLILNRACFLDLISKFLFFGEGWYHTIGVGTSNWQETKEFQRSFCLILIFSWKQGWQKNTIFGNAASLNPNAFIHKALLFSNRIHLDMEYLTFQWTFSLSFYQNSQNEQSFFGVKNYSYLEKSKPGRLQKGESRFTLSENAIKIHFPKI